jgi:hypothetical protein
MFGRCHTISAKELQLLRKACNNLEDGPDYRVNDYVENLMLTVLDFQMDAATVLTKSLAHFRVRYGFKRVHNLKALMVTYPNTRDGNIALAMSLWGYRHWTRAKFLRAIIAGLESEGVRGQKSLKRWLKTTEFDRDIKGRFKTAEHSIGITLYQWLRLRCGFPAIKADLHVLRFVEAAIGRTASPTEVGDGLVKIAEETKRKPYRLDAAIWHFQHDK